MGDAERFRSRAQECRDLAARAVRDDIRAELLDLAGWLDEEADVIDAEEGRKSEE